MARASLWTRLNAAAARAPDEYVTLSICRHVVDVNPEQGGPPVERGLCERVTTQPYGLPAVREKWDPWELTSAAPLTDAETDCYFNVLGVTRQRTAREMHQAFIQLAGAFIWRNAPDGAVIAREVRDGPPVVIAQLQPADRPAPPPY